MLGQSMKWRKRMHGSLLRKPSRWVVSVRVHVRRILSFQARRRLWSLPSVYRLLLIATCL